MKKFLTIVKILMKNAIIRDLKLPGFVTVSIIQEIASIVVNIVFFNVIFANISSLAGWSFYQVLFLYAFSKTITSLSYAFTRYGLKDMGEHMIKYGEYDFHLIKPVDTMALVSFSRPRPTRLIAAVFYLAMAVYCVMKTGIHIEATNVIWFLVLTIFGFVLFYCLEVITVIPAFKLVRVWSLPNIVPKMNEFMRYPIGIFTLPFKIVLFGVFPILAASYLPAEALFYPPKALNIMYMMAIAVLFFIIVRKLWEVLERGYSSASS